MHSKIALLHGVLQQGAEVSIQDKMTSPSNKMHIRHLPKESADVNTPPDCVAYELKLNKQNVHTVSVR